MKKLYAIVACFIMANYCQAQNNCKSLHVSHFYKQDVRSLVVKDIWNTWTDTDKIELPVARVSYVQEGMSAIFNSSSPERDTVFDIMCLHDSTYIQHESHLLVFFDPAYSWTQNWKQAKTFTGNPDIDKMMANYNLVVTGYHNFPNHIIRFQHCVEVTSENVLNMDALEDSLELIAGVNQVDRNDIITPVTINMIRYQQIGNIREYNFILRWSDCFTGCWNERGWVFEVDAGCTAKFVNAWEQIAYPNDPMPAPPNCKISEIVIPPDTTTGVTGYTLNYEVKLYPNPVDKTSRIVLPYNINSGSLEITNSMGQLISKQMVVNELQVVFGDRIKIPGVYYYRLTDRDGNRVYSGKFLYRE